MKALSSPCSNSPLQIEGGYGGVEDQGEMIYFIYNR